MRTPRQVGDTDKIKSTGKWDRNPLFANEGTAPFKSIVTQSFFSQYQSRSQFRPRRMYLESVLINFNTGIELLLYTLLLSSVLLIK